MTSEPENSLPETCHRGGPAHRARSGAVYGFGLNTGTVMFRLLVVVGALIVRALIRKPERSRSAVTADEKS